MGKIVASSLFHALRVVLAALAMLGIGFSLWLVIGFTTAILRTQTPALVAVSAVAIGVLAVSVGGYVSSRYITSRSLLHPMLAGVALALVYQALFASGDIGFLAFGLPIAAGVVAVGGAAFARRHAA